MNLSEQFMLLKVRRVWSPNLFAVYLEYLDGLSLELSNIKAYFPKIHLMQLIKVDFQSSLHISLHIFRHWIAVVKKKYQSH